MSLNLPEFLLDLSAQVEPIFEQGHGLRERLIGEGWSCEAADRIAGEWILQLLNLVFQNANTP